VSVALSAEDVETFTWGLNHIHNLLDDYRATPERADQFGGLVKNVNRALLVNEDEVLL